uniref:N-acetyl-D-glucosamine kinase n=1 Tax=Timema genevievae TaxID=629358 RepID=A0A7R9K3M8_TIMGE|nr:unnamed protein product [Timema genevievae]
MMGRPRGATHSKVVLYNSKGEKLVECSGPGTNHWILGMEECQKRIHNMVDQAKKEAGVPIDEPLTILGMSLSGCEQEETNHKLKQGLLSKYPKLSLQYMVCSDTVGSIATALDKGGIVVIAGTGSNALLLNPDGSVHRCGGWGHMLGDEGSAWWTAHKAMKICIDEQDNFVQPPHSTKFVWGAIKRHFNVETRFDLLDHCYSNFEKSKYAGLTKLLSEGANQGDALCLWLFARAGEMLFKHISALYSMADKSLLQESGGLSVVCVGSVWLSWEHLKPGFTGHCSHPEMPVIPELTLLRLTTSMAAGATYLAAKEIDLDLPRNYQANYTVFFHYKCSKT